MNPKYKFSQRPLVGLIAALSLFAAPMADAMAETVTYNLNLSNVSSFADGINYLQVAITSTVAGTAVFKVTPVYSFVTSENYGLQTFAFNYSGRATHLTFSNLAGWEVNGPPASTMSSFGKFDYIFDGDGSHRKIPLTFTVSGLGGTTTGQTLGYFAKLSSGEASEGNQYFAAHLAGISKSTVSGGSAYFAGAVPEPESYAMLLAGLGMIGAVARRRRMR